MLLLALGLVAAVDAASVEAASRALTAGAATDRRFEVVSQLDVQDALALEANKQLCDVDSSACAEELLGAFDARYVLFSNLYELGGARRLALTLRDLRTGAVVARDDLAADGDFFASASAAAARAVHAVAGQPTERRLFVVRTSTEGTAGAPDVAGTATSPARPLWITTTAVGAVVFVAGGVVGFVANGAIADPDSARSSKDVALIARPVGLVAAGVGAVATVVGVGGLVWGGE